jgi:hypothetical protein
MKAQEEVQGAKSVKVGGRSRKRATAPDDSGSSLTIKTSGTIVLDATIS